MEDAARLIETNLVLLGATAIEDKLQDKVGVCLGWAPQPSRINCRTRWGLSGKLRPVGEKESVCEIIVTDSRAL